jgi:DNA-binding MltR family transcriptional regulator
MTSQSMAPVTPDTPLIWSCMMCGHKDAILARALVRGTEYICENCGKHVKFSGSITRARRTTVHVSHPYEADPVKITLTPDGVWALMDSDLSILDVLNFDSDRAVALIIGSMLENRLQTIITIHSHCDPTTEKTIFERLLNPAGPLGSFSAKIDIAYIIGIISKPAHHDLVRIKNIRNDFAHKLEIKDFRSQTIRDKARDLHLIDTMVDDYKHGGHVANLMPGKLPAISVLHASQRKKHARDRYLMTAQVLMMRFAPAEWKDYPLPLI